MDDSADGLQLTLAPVPRGCRTSLRRAADGQVLAAQEVEVAEPAAGLRAVLAELDGHPEAPVSDASLVDLGDALGGMLLPPQVFDALGMAVAALPAPGMAVRVQLDLPDNRWAALPWEFTRLPAELPGAPGERRLVLHPRVRVARAAAPSREPGPARDGRIVVLLASANPGCGPFGALPGIGKEALSIASALRAPELRRRTDLHVAEGVTPARLRQALGDLQPAILHFAGHAVERPSGTALILEGAKPGEFALLGSQDLLPAGRRAPGLVVLSACRSSSLGRRLVECGCAAAVAMQLRMRDSVAGLFARALYGALTEGASVEDAVQEGRLAVQGAGPDWAVPVLLTPAGAQPLRLTPPVRHERAATARHGPRGGRAGGAPTNLPYARNLSFVGREELLAELDAALLAPSSTPAALLGPSGIGKSQAAVEFAHRRQQDFPGGIYWVDARSTQRLQEEMAGLGRFFRVPERLAVEARAQRVRDALQQLARPALVIADNLTARADVRLLPSMGACRILATTQEAEAAARRCRVLRVDPLPEEAALALLQSGRAASSERERAIAGEVARKVGRLPAALALMAEYVRRQVAPDDGAGGAFERCAGALRDAAGVYRTLTAASERFIATTGHDGRIFDAIAVAHGELPLAARTVLASAACYGTGPVPMALLRAAVRRLLADPEEFGGAVIDLCDRSFATESEASALVFHELVQVFAQNTTPARERLRALSLAAGAALRRLHRANAAKDWSGIRPEVPHVLAAAEQCREMGLPGIEAALRSALGGYYVEHSEARMARGCYLRALALTRRRCGPERAAAAPLLSRLAEISQRLGRPGRARRLAEAALALAEAAARRTACRRRSAG